MKNHHVYADDWIKELLDINQFKGVPEVLAPMLCQKTVIKRGKLKLIFKGSKSHV